MSKRLPNHLHRYKRVRLGKEKKYEVMKCQEPACTHYIEIALAEGKLCACNRCRQPMILDKIAIQLAKPHCPDCTQKRKPIDPVLKALEDLDI